MAFTFGGFDLTQHCYARIDRPVAPKLRLVTDQVPGRDGSALLGIEREPLVITAHLTLRRAYHAQWASVRDLLAAALSSTEERMLVLPDEPGRYRMATASVTTSVPMPFDGPVTFDVEFTCHDPAAYGSSTKSATVPSGGSATITVGGNLPVPLRVVANAAVRDSSTQLWGIRADGQDYMRVKIATSSSRKVEIDGASRTAKVANALDMLTTDSNWVALSPGSHTLAMDKGTGAATVTWRERWL